MKKSPRVTILFSPKENQSKLEKKENAFPRKENGPKMSLNIWNNMVGCWIDLLEYWAKKLSDSDITHH